MEQEGFRLALPEAREWPGRARFTWIFHTSSKPPLPPPPGLSPGGQIFWKSLAPSMELRSPHDFVERQSSCPCVTPWAQIELQIG